MKRIKAVVLTLAAVVGAAASAQSTEGIRVDAAENMPKFVFDEVPVFDNSLPQF